MCGNHEDTAKRELSLYALDGVSAICPRDGTTMLHWAVWHDMIPTIEYVGHRFTRHNFV